MQIGSQYLPSKDYFRLLYNYPNPSIAGGGNWQKQTLRNRTFILSPNGLQRLIVPVIHTGGILVPESEMRIDYSSSWIREHKGALEAGYNTSPFFEFLKDDLFRLYDHRYEFLFDLNVEITKLILRKLKWEFQPVVSRETQPDSAYSEQVNRKEIQEESTESSYPQVFSYKFGFTSGLSALDEICNTGKLDLGSASD